MKTLHEQIIEKQDELIARKCKHSVNCYLNQNWDEARQAMSDTPQEHRDEGYYLALAEINEKSCTCSCGIDEIAIDIISLKSQLEDQKETPTININPIQSTTEFNISKEMTDEPPRCIDCGTPIDLRCERCKRLWER